MEQKASIIRQHGSVDHLLAAYAALETIQDKNFNMSEDFGEPFKITGSGRCNTVCNAAGWVAQHPHFKHLGLKFEERLVRGQKKHLPTLKTSDGATAIGYNALAYVMGMDHHTALKVFSPFYYPEAEKTTVQDVLKRLKSVIGKAGGGDSLKAHLKAQKAALKAKTKGKRGKKQAKNA